MKTTSEKAIITYRILNNAKMGKMEDEAKFTLIKILKELKPIAQGYDDFLKDVAEKLRPDGFDKIQAKIQAKEKLEIDEQRKVEKFNNDVENCLKDELQKECEFSFPQLDENGFKGLLASNDFSTAEAMSLYDVIVG